MTKKTELTAADLRVGQRVVYTSKETGERFVTPVLKIRAHGLLSLEWPLMAELSEIKPILRRLESMSESEEGVYNNLRDAETVIDSDGDCKKYYFETIESALWLIDNNFDVLGYIDAGLAVDAATLEGDANV